MNWKLSPSAWIILGFIGCSAVVIVPVFKSARDNEYRSSCMSNLKVIGLACELYASDNGDKFPPLSSEGKGWAELIAQNSSQALSFSCPSVGNPNALLSDYFFNVRLASLKSANVKDPQSTITFGDGVNNGSTNSHLIELPTHVMNEYSFSARHKGGVNYAFVDGHVKWLLPKHLMETPRFDPSRKANWP